MTEMPNTSDECKLPSGETVDEFIDRLNQDSVLHNFISARIDLCHARIRLTEVKKRLLKDFDIKKDPKALQFVVDFNYVTELGAELKKLDQIYAGVADMLKDEKGERDGR